MEDVRHRQRYLEWLGVIAGLLFWVFDAALDSLVFTEGTFLELLLTAVPAREVYVRTFALVLFIALGVLTSRVVARRMRAEMSLRESEDLLSSVFRAAPIGIGLVSNRVLLGVNRRLCEMTGYEAAEMVGQGARFLYPDQEEFERVGREKYAQIREKGTGTIETRWRRKDGRIIDIILSSTPLDAENLEAGVTFTALDITKRKSAEDALRDSEERFRQVVSTTQDAVMVFDLETRRFIEVNDACLELYGYSREEFLRMTHDRVTAEPDETDRSIREVSAGQTSKIPLRYHRKKDGTVFPAEITGSVFLLGGRQVGCGMIRDISDRYELEEHLRRVQRLKAVGQLAGGIAHDFNNLLLVIGGFAERIERKLGPDHSVHPYAEKILHAAGTAKDLTQQLLAFSRKQVLERKTLDLNTVLRNVESMLRPLIGESIRLTTDLAADLRPVRSDPAQLEQVIVNLAVNARDAMPRGGELRLVTGNVEIDGEFVAKHEWSSLGPHVLLSVEDDGNGMTAEVQTRVFEPFYTTKDRGRGTGLGLSTVYGIVKQSGGSIYVESRLGEGTRIDVYLPAAEVWDEAAGPTAEDGEPAGGTETVLVAEDEAGVREFVEEVLAEAGYRVLVAVDGQDAVAVAEEFPGEIDLLVTDVVMPRLGGTATFEAIGAERPGLKVIYMSGYDGGVVEAETGEGGVECYLQKPFSPDELLSKLRDVLGAEAPPVCR